VRELLHAAEPGSDRQLTFARAYGGAVVSDAGKAEVTGLLDGSETIEGLEVDTDLRWMLLIGLAKVGAADDARIDQELDRDRTISGQEYAAAARASQPTAEAKAAAWAELVDNPDVPNETHRSIASSFMRFGQEDVLEPYVERYLEAADTIWDRLGTHMASNALGSAFPLPLGSEDLVARVDRWLEESPANPAAKRFVQEGRADVLRALAAQQKDAASR
jgi:aminopeptidase N